MICGNCEGRGRGLSGYACAACGGTGSTDSPLTGVYRKHGSEWCVQVQSGAPKVGRTVTVRKRSGEIKTETIAEVLSGGLCAIVATTRPARPFGRSRYTRFNSGAESFQNERGRCEDAPCCGCCS